jgi:hypothetical protein
MRDVNRMDGGYAYRPPADTMAEFRILTTTAPAEFGGTSGGITTIVTRSGTNSAHGTLYEFLRNDALDANNYFAPRKEELKQNQFGGTIGGPMVHNHAYFFAYYEGLRDNQDITHGVVVPTVAERTGDFSADAPILFNSTKAPYTNNLAGLISPITAKYLTFFPIPNTQENPHLAQTTNLSQYTGNQGGAKADWLLLTRSVPATATRRRTSTARIRNSAPMFQGFPLATPPTRTWAGSRRRTHFPCTRC